MRIWHFLLILVVALSLFGCTSKTQQYIEESASKSLESTIPEGKIKITPEMDVHPPVLHSDEYYEPVPFEPLSSAGAEDSAYYAGDKFYFFFTPDVDVPVNEQLIDGATGTWMIKREGDGWSEPERVILNDDVSLDGCAAVYLDELWFCSVRAGNMREIDIYKATYDGEKWNVESAGEQINLEYGVGELHITSDGQELYFHTDKDGNRNIYVLKKKGGEWQPPELVENINSEYDDGYPFVTEDGSELWFTRGPAAPEIWRSKRVDGEWQEPERIISTFAGEPTLDEEGNVYFTHHFFKDDKMLEADIYVARKK